MTLNIRNPLLVREWTTMPGARYRWIGESSAEEFRDEWLLPSYDAAVAAGEKLVVEIDGVEGYLTSWQEEAFGGLVRERGADVPNNLVIVTKFKPRFDDVMNYINNAVRHLTDDN